MKNKRIIDSWNKIEPDSTADKRMLNTILALNHLAKTGNKRVYSVNRILNRKYLVPIAACLAMAIAIAMPFLNNGSGDFNLKLSNGVKVNYVDNPPAITNGASLMWLTEDELFGGRFEGYEIVIFKGTVAEVRNIVCDYNGFKNYRAIATIDVSEVLRGNLEAGTTATVLLPAPVGIDMQITDSSISSRLTAGTTGIFMPMKYDETSIREENGKTLALLDLADYGLPDGERWMFIKTADALAYNKNAYPSFAEAKDLKDIKEIILSKIK